MKYIEALEKRDRLLSKLEENLLELENIKDEIRELGLKSVLRKVEVVINNSYAYITAGIDSARGIKRYIPSNFYAYVCISYRENIEKYLQEADFDMIGFVEEEVEFADRILEGMSMGAEILLAQKELRNVDLIFMDGSVSTFIIKINSAITAAVKSDGVLSSKLKTYYNDIINAFLDILSSGKVIFVPKSTQKDDLKSFVLNKLSSSSIEDFLDKLKSISDIKLAQIILNPLEYIKVHVSKHPYNLHNPYEEGSQDYESFNQKKEELFNLANNPEVIYFKGISGYAYRIENFTSTLPMDLIAQYTFGKTFYLTTEADRKAKDYVKTLLQEGFPLEEEIR